MFTVRPSLILLGGSSFYLCLLLFQQLSISIQWTLGLICVGGLWTLYDAQNELRRWMVETLRIHLNQVVLDQVLKSIFDPEIGVIATFWGTIMGTAAMYALPLDDHDKTRLVQSCLWSSPEQSKRILYQPGGIVELFPIEFQQWFKDKQEAEVEEEEEQEQVEEEQVEETQQQQEQQEQKTKSINDNDKTTTDTDNTAKAKGNNNTFEVDTETSSQTFQDFTVQQHPPDDPLVVFGCILKDLIVKKLSSSFLRGISLASLTSLVLYLRSSSRTRQIVLGCVEGCSVLSLMGIILGASTVSMMQQQQLQKENTILKDIQQRVQRWIPTITRKRLKAVVAVLVCFLVGRIRAKPHKRVRR